MIATTIQTVLRIKGELVISKVIAVVRQQDDLKFVAQRVIDPLMQGATVIDAWLEVNS